MSISDWIVVMKEGVVQQIGKPQEVYDDPVNLFVAKFLGTPPISVFDGEIRKNRLYIGSDAVLEVKNVSDQPVHVGIRPEGFSLQADGPLHCRLNRLEVMGRDVSVVSTHANSQNLVIRAIIESESQLDTNAETIGFAVKPRKLFLFHKETEERIRFELG